MFMEVWTQRSLCKVIHLLYLHFVFTPFLFIICEFFI